MPAAHDLTHDERKKIEKEVDVLRQVAEAVYDAEKEILDLTGKIEVRTLTEEIL